MLTRTQMTIATFVDPSIHQRDLALDLGIAIAEYSVSENHPLYLLTDAGAALAIGLALLGARASRKLEGGKYHKSPICLLPSLRKFDSIEDELLTSPEVDGVGGGIEEMHRLGLFADPEEYDGELELKGEPEVVFERVIANSPDLILGIGAESRLWQTVSRGLSRAKVHFGRTVACVEGFEPIWIDPSLTVTTVGRDNKAGVRASEFYSGDDEYGLEEARRDAEQNGLLVAALLEFLVRSQ